MYYITPNNILNTKSNNLNIISIGFLINTYYDINSHYINFKPVLIFPFQTEYKRVENNEEKIEIELDKVYNISIENVVDYFNKYIKLLNNDIITKDSYSLKEILNINVYVYIYNENKVLITNKNFEALKLKQKFYGCGCQRIRYHKLRDEWFKNNNYIN